MIIEDAENPNKATTPLLRERSGSAAAPPAYAPREIDRDAAQAKRRNSAARRFFRAFLVAVGIWVLVSALAGSTGTVRSRWHWSLGYPTIPDVVLDCRSSWPEKQNDNHIEAAFPYYVDLAFGVPLPPASLLVFSRGGLSAGSFKVTADVLESEMALIRVKTHYFMKEVRDEARVCLVGRKEGEWGLAIFTPRSWRSLARTERLFFEVVLTLPRRNSSAIHLNRLETDLENMEQIVEPPEDLVHFGHLSLKGSDGGIQVKAVKADSVTFAMTNGAVFADNLVSRSITASTTNAGISGTFKAGEFVDLRTSNAPIRVDIELDAGTSSGTNGVVIKTSNDNIQSSIRLGTAPNASGSFCVEQETSNGQLLAEIATLPLDATLDVTATTSNAPVMLNLPSTYEGDLDIHATGHGGFSVRPVDPLKPDPGSMGRERMVETRRLTLSSFDGSVFWERGNMHRGRARVRADRGAANIFF